MFKILEVSNMFTLVDMRDGTERAVHSARHDGTNRDAALMKFRGYAMGFIDGFSYCRSTIPNVYLSETVETL